MMYFTTGGRNTTGGLWRLRYTGTAPAAPDMTGILAVVRQPQPLSSWGWAAIEKVKASMGAGFGGELEKVARNASAPGMERARAIYEMQRHGAAPSAALLTALDQGRQRRRARRRDLRGRRAGRGVEDGRGGCAQGSRPGRAPARRRSARAHGPVAGQAQPRARGRYLRAAQRPRSVRPLVRPHRARAHRARGVEGSRPLRDQSARRARRDARLGPDGQRREPPAARSTSSSPCSSRRTSRPRTSCGSTARSCTRRPRSRTACPRPSASS